VGLARRPIRAGTRPSETRSFLKNIWFGCRSESSGVAAMRGPGANSRTTRAASYCRSGAAAAPRKRTTRPATEYCTISSYSLTSTSAIGRRSYGVSKTSTMLSTRASVRVASSAWYGFSECSAAAMPGNSAIAFFATISASSFCCDDAAPDVRHRHEDAFRVVDGREREGQERVSVR
jgi:hypothetical protein